MASEKPRAQDLGVEVSQFQFGAGASPAFPLQPMETQAVDQARENFATFLLPELQNLSLQRPRSLLFSC